MYHYQKELLAYIHDLTIIDTHEHIPISEKLRDQRCDILGEYLFHYLSSDLISAGLSFSELNIIKDPSIPLLSRWDRVAPYWSACRYTGYMVSLEKAVKRIYGIDRIERDTIEALNARFQAARAEGRAYQTVLKDISKVETCLADCYYPDMLIQYTPDRTFFTPVLNIGALVNPGSTETLSHIETDVRIQINSLSDYCKAVTAVVNKYAGEIKLLKCALAYNRSLDFGEPNHAEAEENFNQNLRLAVPGPGAEYADLSFNLELQNYIMHSILSFANQKGMTFQFHTGLQEGNGNYLNRTDPTHLTGLIVRYKNVTFDLFHLSYPFSGKAGVMAKNFPNVTLDMCWAHIISPRASINTLLEWLDVVPYTKISGFGGDYCFVDGIAGHQQMARENIARALAICCTENTMDLIGAKQVAKALLYDNPKRIFQL